jgi:hypothetical protein
MRYKMVVVLVAWMVVVLLRAKGIGGVPTLIAYWNSRLMDLVSTYRVKQTEYRCWQQTIDDRQTDSREQREIFFVLLLFDGFHAFGGIIWWWWWWGGEGRHFTRNETGLGPNPEIHSRAECS